MNTAAHPQPSAAETDDKQFFNVGKCLPDAFTTGGCTKETQWGHQMNTPHASHISFTTRVVSELGVGAWGNKAINN